MNPPFEMGPLTDDSARAAFRCGEEALDRYFHQQVTQDVRRRVAACFVATDASTGRVAGFSTIASACLAFTELPAAIAKRLPRYPSLPAVRIGRLAVDLDFRGRGLGGALLADALKRVLQSPPAAFALLVEAKDDRAAAFYLHHGFIALASTPQTLFLPIATAKAALG